MDLLVKGPHFINMKAETERRGDYHLRKDTVYSFEVQSLLCSQAA